MLVGTWICQATQRLGPLSARWRGASRFLSSTICALFLRSCPPQNISRSPCLGSRHLSSLRLPPSTFLTNQSLRRTLLRRRKHARPERRPSAPPILLRSIRLRHQNPRRRFEGAVRNPHSNFATCLHADETLGPRSVSLYAEQKC